MGVNDTLEQLRAAQAYAVELEAKITRLEAERFGVTAYVGDLEKERDTAWDDRDAALERLGQVLALHEVATQRTVDLAAVIEQAFAILDQNTETGGGVWVMARDAHAVLRKEADRG